MGMFPDGRRTFLSVSHAADPTQLQIGWLPELNDGTGEGIGPRSIAIGPGTNGTPYLWVGGEFTRVNGANQQGLTRFSPTDTGAPPVPALAARAITPNAVQVNIRGVYDPDDSDITYAVYRGNNTTTPVWTGVAQSKHWYRFQATFVDTDVAPGTSYTYRVRAIDRANNQSALSGTATVTASATGSVYASTVIADQPRLFYRYDDTANAQWVVDSAGPTVVGLNGLAQNGVNRTAAGAIPNDASRSATFTDTQAERAAAVHLERRHRARTHGVLGGDVVPHDVGHRWGAGQLRILDGASSYATPGSIAPAARSTASCTWRTGPGSSGSACAPGSARPRCAASRRSTTASGTTWSARRARAACSFTSTESSRRRTPPPAAARTTARGTSAATASTATRVRATPWSTATSTVSSTRRRCIYQALSPQQVQNHFNVGTGFVDTVVPSTPQGVAASFDGANVDVTWTASTDNVGVAGYRVYRGTTAGFTPAADTLRGTVAGTTFEDVAPPPGTFYYKVVAFDGANNASAASAASAPVTVVDGVAPSVPTGVTAVAAGQAADISWTASTDNAGVTGYALYRGSDAGFVPSMETLIQPNIVGTSYHDAPLSEGTWYYKVTARDAAGNVSGASSAASVVIVAPDSTPPSVPGGLTADVDGANVTLDWSASTDNVGVTGYLVYRGTTAGFTADDASRIGDVVETTFTDSARPQGTWFYKVAARDGSSNVSAASAAASATVTNPPAPPTTQTIVTTADSMAAAINPTFAYGATNQISSRFNTTIESFLRFDLPAAPAGQVLTSATISLRTSNDSTAGSTDIHEFRLVSGTWQEGTITWNNRPTSVGAAVLGQLTGATALNSPYIATLSAADLGPLAGTSITLRLSSPAGSDNVRLWSREATSPDYRPTLTLTYTTP